jgi:hypothetical protein
MRIWDVEPKILCRQHLLGEHRELHALWSIIKNSKSGYSKHPETLRWYGKLPALRKRHELLVAEMERRGYVHATPLPEAGGGSDLQDQFVNTIDEQLAILKEKDCDCPFDKTII